MKNTTKRGRPVMPREARRASRRRLTVCIQHDTYVSLLAAAGGKLKISPFLDSVAWATIKTDLEQLRRLREIVPEAPQ